MLLIRCYKRRYTSWLWGGKRIPHCCACAKFTSTPSSDENVDCFFFATSAKMMTIEADSNTPNKKCTSVVLHAASSTTATSLFCFMKLWAKLPKKFALLCSLSRTLSFTRKLSSDKKKKRERRKLNMWAQYCRESICASQTRVEQQVITVLCQHVVKSVGGWGRAAVKGTSWGWPECRPAGFGCSRRRETLHDSAPHTHCVNSADVPSPEISQHISSWKGEGTSCCGAVFQRGGAQNSEREVGLFQKYYADCEAFHCRI